MKKIIFISLILGVVILGFLNKDKIANFLDKDIMLKPELIQVSSPKINEIISSPLEITGQARGYWYFEASFPIQLVDENNQVIATAIAQAQSDWMTEDFVPFKATLNFSGTAGKKGVLVLKKDNPSGLSENDNQIRIPVIIQTSETMEVKVYFNNSDLDPEFSCNKVFPVLRIIPKTRAIARAALEELLKGATAEEQRQGFLTSLNPNVKIQKLTIEKGIAEVDFDDQLEFQVGGSCRVSAIRAQIAETLKQFPTVQEVVISINGRTEDILQP